MSKKIENEAFDVVSQATSGITQAALNAYTNGGGRSLSGATYIAMGAVLGPLTVLSTLVAPKDKAPTDDTLLFAALLITAVNKIGAKSLGDVPAPNGRIGTGTEVAVQSDWNHQTQLEALRLFEKLTGRSPDGHVNANLLQAAREAETTGNAEADKLLSAICANHKPA